ncbi:MAG: glycerophosphodiester phosphodiesterase family protein [Patescibacteria group bacterium]
MYFQQSIVLFSFCLVSSCSFVNISNGANINKSRPTVLEVTTCIRDPNCHKHFVVAHRANGFGAPENSREAVRKAVETGVSAVEIDVRVSKDNELFIMHDSSLDRTTNSTGLLRNMLSEDLAGVRLKENNEFIPTIQDIYEITHGLSVIFVDIKGDCVRVVVEWIAQHGSFDDIVFFINNKKEFSAAAEMKQKYPDMMIAARAHSKQDIENIKKFFPHMPEILNIGFPSIHKFALIADYNSKVYVSSLVFEIGLPFLKPTWFFYINLWYFNFLESNNPMFWR